jgi:pyruvate/2-oxoglutarate dehydrogenase complex dihydrolipoamide acyltransferase (E2) component
MIMPLIVPGPIEDVEEVRVLEWHRSEGMVVQPGELLVELETDKAIVEIRPTRQGILRRIVCREGEWQALGSAIALFSDTPDEPLPETLPQEAEFFPVEFAVT